MQTIYAFQSIKKKEITSLKIQYCGVSIILGYVSLGISTELIAACLLSQACS